tara:strand:- start:12157 stop:12330 length:174 start_codon:yes stop_codon:yes gene_type:complete
MITMGKNRIVATGVFVQWNDNPKMEIVSHAMPDGLRQAFDDWLTSIEHERNQGEKDD